MRVAIIDDGIAQGSLLVPVYSFCFCVGMVQESTKIVSEFSHGTLCARIVTHKLTSIEIICISIYSECEDGKEEDLLTALRWCLDHHVDYINLSNGITSFFHNEAMNNICYQLWRQNTIIIAGISNDWKYTVPAHLPYVISVSKYRFRDMFAREYFVKADKQINGFAQFSDRDGKKHFESHNSFACARMTNTLLRKKVKKRTMGKTISNNVIDFSLLKDVQIWSDKPIDYDLLAFPIDKERLVSDITSASILVIASNNPAKQIIERLRRLTSKPQMIIWCDKSIPISIRKWCKKQNISHWKEPRSSFSPIFSRRHLQKLTDSFVVGVKGSTDINTLIQVKRSFEKAGYTVLLFSRQKYSYLYGAIMPKTLFDVQQGNKTINPDVIILDNIQGVACDVCLFFSPQCIYLNTEEASTTIYTTVKNGEYDEIVKTIEDINAIWGDDEL